MKHWATWVQVIAFIPPSHADERDEPDRDDDPEVDVHTQESAEHDAHTTHLPGDVGERDEQCRERGDAADIQSAATAVPLAHVGIVRPAT